MGYFKRFSGSRSFGGGGSRRAILQIREQTFFNRRPVINALDQKWRSVMAKLGGFMRTTIQRSMRHKDGPSKEGKPPHAHRDYNGNAGKLRALVEFGYDQSEKALVVGPHKIDSPTIPLEGKTVPQLHNEGGRAFITTFGGRSVIADFAPRPFIEPAREKAFTKLANLIKTIPLKFRGR